VVRWGTEKEGKGSPVVLVFLLEWRDAQIYSGSWGGVVRGISNMTPRKVMRRSLFQMGEKMGGEREYWGGSTGKQRGYRGATKKRSSGSHRELSSLMEEGGGERKTGVSHFVDHKISQKGGCANSLLQEEGEESCSQGVGLEGTLRGKTSS